MPDPRDPTKLTTADLCRKKGCERRRLGPSDLCSTHLNEKLEAERAAREKARAEGAGNWAGWDLPPPVARGGILNRLIDRATQAGSAAAGTAAQAAGAGAEPPGGAAQTETLRDVRADIAATIERGLEKLGVTLPAALQPRKLIERVEKGMTWLTPEQETDAWRAIRGLVERGVTDMERWRAAIGRIDLKRIGGPPEGPRPAGTDPEVEREIARAVAEGLAAAAGLIVERLKEGIKVAAKVVEQASREGGPLDPKRLAGIADAMVNEGGPLSGPLGALFRRGAEALRAREAHAPVEAIDGSAGDTSADGGEKSPT